MLESFRPRNWWAFHRHRIVRILCSRWRSKGTYSPFAMNQSSAGIGWSSLPEAAKAGREAAEMALRTAKVGKPVAAIVYMTVLYDPKAVLAAVRETLGDSSL